MEKGVFVVLEGINGSGKGTCARFLADHLASKGLKEFNTSTFGKETKAFPEYSDFANSDFVYSSEPTYAWCGAAIRNEGFFDNGRSYSATTMLNAFALDRHSHYKRVIVPALLKGKHVIQERSFATTLAFQTTGPNAVSFSRIINHPDHEYILEHLPSLIILVDASPEQCATYLSNREKKDHDIFENYELEVKHRKMYTSTRYQRFFTSRGVKFVTINNNGTIEELRSKCIEASKESYRDRFRHTRL